MRKFEICKGYEDKATLPVRGSKGSAGYDFHIISPSRAVIKPQETVKFETGIIAYMEDNEVLTMHIRSSVGIKRNIVLSNITGVIDSDFKKPIIIALTNIGDKSQIIEPNERVAQGIFMKYLTTDDDNADAERTGGIGSTNNE